MLVTGFASSQNRWDLGGPGAGVTTVSPFGQPNVIAVPSVKLNWCAFPANSTGSMQTKDLTACTNFAPTYTSLTLLTACPSSAPIVYQTTATCVSQSDIYGNMGVYAPAGTYAYTLTIGAIVYGPYTVTLGGSGGSGGGTVKVNNGAAQSTTNLNSGAQGPAADSGFTLGAWKTDSSNTTVEFPTLPPTECQIGSGLGSQLNIGFQNTTNPCVNPAIEIIQQANGGMGLFGPITFFGMAFIENGADLGPNGFALNSEVANCPTTGTVANQIAKLSTNAGGICAVSTGNADVNAEGIVTATGGTTGNATIARVGNAGCVFDGPTTAGDQVVNSTTAAPQCHDAGTSAPTAGSLGVVFSTHASAGTYEVRIASGGSSGGILGATVGGGLEQTGSTLGLLKSCGAGQVLAWNGTTWACSTPGGGGNVTAGGTLANNVGIVGAGGTAIQSDTNFDDGVTTANTFTVKSSNGLAVNSGGVVNLLSMKDSSSNCPVTITSGFSAFCSASFIPQWIQNNSGTPLTWVIETQNNKGAANGYAGLDGSLGVPAVNLLNFPAAWFDITTNTSLSVAPSGSIWTAGDYGSSPDSTVLGVTDNATSAADNSTNFFTDTGSSSVHVSFAARIRGVNQFQIVQQQSGAQGQILMGSVVVPTSISNSPFAKTISMSQTAGHTVHREWQASNAATGDMNEWNIATTAGTGCYFLKAFTGVTSTDTSSGGGTLTASLRCDGLWTGGFAAGATAHATLISEGNAAAAVAGNVGTLGQVWTSNGPGNDPSMQTPASGFANPMTTLGDLIYENATPAAARLAGPTTPNGVPATLSSIPVAGAAVTPIWNLPGLGGRKVVTSASVDTILATDCNPGRVYYTGSTAQPITLPTATTLGVPFCAFKIVNNSTATATVTPTTWTIGPSAAATLTILEGQQALISVDPGSATNWAADVSEQGITAGGNVTLTRAIGGLTIASSAGSVFPATVSGTVISGGVPYFNSTTQESSSALLATGALVAGGGAGQPPTTGAGDFTYATHTITGGASAIIDLSAAPTTTGFLLPKAAGAVPTADGQLAENTTIHALVYGSNGNTVVSAAAALGTTVSTTCATHNWFNVLSGVAAPTCTQPAFTDISGTATAAQLPATPLTTGTSVSLTAPRQYVVCTSTCTVTPPVPAAGDEFCVMNDDNVATVITMAAIGTSARYENTARTAYGTAGTGTFISGGAVGDKVCLLGRDATHYLTVSFVGTWVAN